MAQNEIFSRYALMLCNFVIRTFMRSFVVLSLVFFVVCCAVLCTVNRRSTFKWSKISTHVVVLRIKRHTIWLCCMLILDWNLTKEQQKTRHINMHTQARTHTHARTLNQLWVLSNDAFLSIFDNIYALAWTHLTK